MKNSIYIFILGAFALSLVSSDSVSYPSANNSAFQIGEKLRYRVTYGFVDAGEAVMEVKSTSKKVNGREMFHLKGRASDINDKKRNIFQSGDANVRGAVFRNPYTYDPSRYRYWRGNR